MPRLKPGESHCIEINGNVAGYSLQEPFDNVIEVRMKDAYRYPVLFRKMMAGITLSKDEAEQFNLFRNSASYKGNLHRFQKFEDRVIAGDPDALEKLLQGK
jgi:hypothetical protein